MFAQYDDIVTIDDLQEMVGLGRNKAYELLQTGQIKSFKLGKAYRIPKICIQDYILSKVLMTIEHYKTLNEN
jgi:excisionase family DNA binding protein